MMNTEINRLISRINDIQSGEPWYGRSVYSLLEEVDPAKAHTPVQLPNHPPGHTLASLLWHMISWAGFTLQHIRPDKDGDPEEYAGEDWRTINPKLHTWKKGLATYKSIHRRIIQCLKKKDDLFLDKKVENRNYNTRFLINGMIDHNIYHAGQIAYIHKLLE